MKWLQSKPFLLLLLPLLGVIIWCSLTNRNEQLKALDIRPVASSAQAWQKYLCNRYSDLGIYGLELETLQALTLGYRDGLDKDLKRSFSAAGAMHVLAVSGLHTGLLMSALMALITCFGLRKPLYEQKQKRIVISCFLMLVLIMYAYVTGGSPSVVRSVIMACLGLLAYMTSRHPDILNIICASAFIMLILVPNDWYSVSFRLSYAAVIAIVLFIKGWHNLLPPVYGNPWKIKIVGYVHELVGVSIAAQMGTLPFTLYYFGQISNYFLLTNLLIIPLAWLMMLLFVFLFTIGWIAPLGTALSWLLIKTTWCMNTSVRWIENLPYATTNIALPVFGIVLVAAGIWGFLIVWYSATSQRLQWT
ncbi:MAG: ComEC/Rec2 family competence protein [Paludibacteraceae bacterium]|nr:ComEC/Rec2 family competence protein [Paludibacteraceae bacterium]